jgi:hypothetical protein
MHDLEVQSPWGAIAAIVLLQCFGAILFNALLYHLGPDIVPSQGSGKPAASHLIVRVLYKLFISLWSLGWASMFLMFEAVVITLIIGFFHKNGLGTLLHPVSPLAIVKLVLTLAFARMLVFLQREYPFAKPRGQRLAPLFLVGTLLLSTFVSKHHALSIAHIASGGSCIVGLLVGLLFFTVGCAAHELFYMFGLLGGGVTVMMACSMLLQHDEFSIDGVFLCVVTALLLLWQMRHRKKEATPA